MKKQEGYTDVPTPDIVFLDLNMPRKDGRELLADIKKDPSTKNIPIVVMTTSKSEEDILRSYKLQANCYIRKPMDLDQLIKVIGNIEEFWLRYVVLPKKDQV